MIVVPAVILLILHILIVPESPRWLAQRGKANLAWKTLRRMRRSSAQTRHELRCVRFIFTQRGGKFRNSLKFQLTFFHFGIY